MTLYLELSGEEFSSEIEEIIERETGRKCKCGYLEEINDKVWHYVSDGHFPKIEPNMPCSECVVGVDSEGGWKKIFFSRDGHFYEDFRFSHKLTDIVKWTYIKVN